MEINNIKLIEAKYWEGTATMNEEQVFFNLSKENQIYLTRESREMIAVKSELASLRLNADFENEFWAKVEAQDESLGKVVPIYSSFFFLKYAAVGIVIISLGFSLGQFFSNENNPKSTIAEIAQNDTYLTPEEAFEETKRALQFASNKLNKGNKHLNELSRFDVSMQAAEAVIK